MIGVVRKHALLRAFPHSDIQRLLLAAARAAHDNAVARGEGGSDVDVAKGNKRGESAET